MKPDQERLSEQAREQRERLRRAAEDGERLYRVRMHGASGVTIADDNRIDGILTYDLVDALGLVDSLARQLTEAERALAGVTPESPWDVDQDCRYCAGHYDWHEDDCAWKIAREALDTGGSEG